MKKSLPAKMQETEYIKIAIAEPSVIIRSGLSATLKRIQGLKIQPFEFQAMDSLLNYLQIHKPDILIINPSFWGYYDVSKLKAETKNFDLNCIALIYSPIDESLLKGYSDIISISDDLNQLELKLNKLFATQEDNADLDDDVNALSVREKEIITCVVKGLTNKDIAQQLFLSTHTVISHRRNIARKLEIHSTAGLTIYAIVNKLVELDEIKKNLS